VKIIWIVYHSLVKYVQAACSLWQKTPQAIHNQSILVAEPSRPTICSRSLAGVAGSNPAAGAWRSVCYGCCVLSGRGFCHWPITHPEESYRVWCVWMWSRNLNDQEPRPTGGCHDRRKKYFLILCFVTFSSFLASWRIRDLYLEQRLESFPISTCLATRMQHSRNINSDKIHYFKIRAVSFRPFKNA
jgi:hypothetical protein